MFNADLMQFKDDMLKTFRELEKKLLQKIATSNEEITKNITSITDSIKTINHKNANIMDTISNNEYKLEKLTDIEQQIQKINTKLTSQENKFNVAQNDLNYVKSKCEKPINDNFEIPGLIGFANGCKYTSLVDYITKSINDIQLLKSEKEDVARSKKDLALKIKKGLESMSLLADSCILRAKSYTDTTKGNILEKIEIMFNELKEKNFENLSKIIKVETQTDENLENIKNLCNNNDNQIKNINQEIIKINKSIEELKEQINNIDKEYKEKETAKSEEIKEIKNKITNLDNLIKNNNDDDNDDQNLNDDVVRYPKSRKLTDFYKEPNKFYNGQNKDLIISENEYKTNNKRNSLQPLELDPKSLSKMLNYSKNKEIKKGATNIHFKLNKKKVDFAPTIKYYHNLIKNTTEFPMPKFHGLAGSFSNNSITDSKKSNEDQKTMKKINENLSGEINSIKINEQNKSQNQRKIKLLLDKNENNFDNSNLDYSNDINRNLKTLYNFNSNVNKLNDKNDNQELNNSHSPGKNKSKLSVCINKIMQLRKKQADETHFSTKNKKDSNYLQYSKNQKNLKFPPWETFEKLNKYNQRSFHKTRNFFNRNDNNKICLTNSIDNIDRETGTEFKIVVIDPENTIIKPNHSNGLMTLMNRRYENKHIMKRNSLQFDDICRLYDNDKNNKTVKHINKRNFSMCNKKI